MSIYPEMNLYPPISYTVVKMDGEEVRAIYFQHCKPTNVHIPKHSLCTLNSYSFLF